MPDPVRSLRTVDEKQCMTRAKAAALVARGRAHLRWYRAGVVVLPLAGAAVAYVAIRHHLVVALAALCVIVFVAEGWATRTHLVLPMRLGNGRRATLWIDARETDEAAVRYIEMVARSAELWWEVDDREAVRKVI